MMPPCVRADSFTEALGTILVQFTSWIYDDELERRYGLIPSYSDLVVRLGRIDYGLAFIERYKEHLNENSTIPVKEILESGDIKPACVALVQSTTLM